MNEKIKRLVEERGLTQNELAEIAGTSRPFITNLLNGYKMPSVPVLKRIADYFGVSVDDLID